MNPMAYIFFLPVLDLSPLSYWAIALLLSWLLKSQPKCQTYNDALSTFCWQRLRIYVFIVTINGVVAVAAAFVASEAPPRTPKGR